MDQFTYVAKASASLTSKASRIFGELVECAYVGCEEFRSSELDSLLKRHSSSDGDQIDLDYGLILIKFKNGKLVKFSSSEWGDISNIDHFLELT